MDPARKDEKTVAFPQAQERIAADLQCDLGGGRIIALKTTFLQSSDQKEMNAVLDRLYLATDRLKARPEIDQLQKGVTTNKKILADNQHALDVAEQDHKTKVDEIRKEILKLREQASAAEVADRAMFEARDRRGEYKPTPKLISQKDQLKQAEIKLAGKIDALDAERDKARRDLGIVEEKAKREIAVCEKAIQERQKLIAAE